ncbi:tyrosine-type recombinase/integrase [Litoribacter alkaliphilus]|uniref:Tyrosine-type recombinase/integrase n=1 Tax=Litoribacter ruber TaxID=702568 RepID=A0AAP2G1R0_9BACT|nr:site-specific integrase [Litoribacter alkaliphilus]MBS9525034.1 tyrosine-type recombinase/integrase [Litoribacter alkaliphilus]
MNIKPILKNVSAKTGVGTVYVGVDFYNLSSREQVFFKTPIKIEKKYWNPAGKIKLHPNRKELTDHLNREIKEVFSLIDTLKAKGEEVTADSLKMTKEVKRVGVKDLITLSKEYVSLRMDFKQPMKRKFNNLITRMEDFTKGKKLYYSHINQRWVNTFIKYLQTEFPKHENPQLRKVQSPSTIHKSFRLLIQILNHYHKTGLIDDKFKNLNFPKTFRQKKMVFVEDEIKQILGFNPPTKSLQKVKDLALLQLFTGLRYSDAVKVNKANIINQQLHITATKTHQNIYIPLHPALVQLFEKYNYDFSPLKISNQKYNKYLKTLVEEAGVTSKAEHVIFKDGEHVTVQMFKYELVGSHTFRRTFITNAIIKGIPLHVIQSITGHTTLDQLTEYVNIADSIKAREIHKMNELFKVA